MDFDKHLRKQGIEESIIEKIMGVDYQINKENPKQNTADFMEVALHKCEELLSYDTISEIMFDRACCKTGIRLNNSKAFAKEHANKTIEEKLKLLCDVPNMGKPCLNSDGDIETVAVGSFESNGMVCPCWQLGGATPVNGPMPLSYCKCCAGHFRFHYQKALNEKLRLKEVLSSILNSNGRLPCVFVYEIKKL
jgi:hypothetical protein